MPRWLSLVFAPPSTPLSPLARYTRWNGLFYMANGAVFYGVPGLLTLLPGMAGFVGFEEGFVRALGVTLAIIGWFYVAGARTNQPGFALATVLHRALVPVFLVPLVVAGQIPAPLGIAFSVLDPLLALGAWLIWARTDPSAR